MPVSSSKTNALPPCKVCGHPSTGFHYGVNTCVACKGFFRRSLSRPVPYVCARSGRCIVGQGKKRRANCSKCRLDRCIAVGMSKSAIKTGRYSSEKRIKDALEILQGGNWSGPNSYGETNDDGTKVQYIDQNLRDDEGSLHKAHSFESSGDGSSSDLSCSPPSLETVAPQPLSNDLPNLSGVSNRRVQNGFYEGTESGEKGRSSDHVFSDHVQGHAKGSHSDDSHTSKEVSLEDVADQHKALLKADSTSKANKTLSKSAERELINWLDRDEVSESTCGNWTAEILPFAQKDVDVTQFGNGVDFFESITDNSNHKNADFSRGSYYKPIGNDQTLNHAQSGQFNDVVVKEDSSTSVSINELCFNSSPSFHYSETTDTSTRGLELHNKNVELNDSSHRNLDYSNLPTVCYLDKNHGYQGFIPPAFTAMVKVGEHTKPAQRRKLEAIINPGSNTAIPHTDLTSEAEDFENIGSKIRKTKLDQKTDESTNVSNQVAFGFTDNSQIEDILTSSSSEQQAMIESKSPATGYRWSQQSPPIIDEDALRILEDMDALADEEFLASTEEKGQRESERNLKNEETVLPNQCNSCIEGIKAIHLSQNDQSDISTNVSEANTDLHSFNNGNDTADDNFSDMTSTTNTANTVTNATVKVNKSSTASSFPYQFTESQLQENGLSLLNCPLDTLIDKLDCITDPVTGVEVPRILETVSFFSYESSVLTPILERVFPNWGENNKFAARPKYNPDFEHRCKPSSPQYDASDVKDMKESVLKDSSFREHEDPPWCEFTEAELDAVIEGLTSAHVKYEVIDLNELPDEEIRFRQLQYLCICHLKKQVFGKRTFEDSFDVYTNILDKTGVDIDGRKNWYENSLPVTEDSLRSMVQFFKAIPGFSDLCQEDKVTLVKSCLYEYWILGHFKGFNSQHEINLYHGMASNLKEYEQFQAKYNVQGLFDTLRVVATKLQHLNLSVQQLLLLRAIVLTTPDRHQLKELDKVEQLYWKYHCCLLLILTRTEPDPYRKYSQIMSALTLLRTWTDANIKHKQSIKVLLKNLAKDIGPPPLYFEMILERNLDF